MLSFRPGSTVVHRLDPRSKLALQAAVAIAAVGHDSLVWLAGLTGLALLALGLARLSPLRALWAYRVVIGVLALGPVIAGVRLGAPWFAVDPALASLRQVARLLPVLLLSAAYIHATPVRDTRAAVQRTVPGRPGQLLGVGVGLTVRLVPLLRAEVGRIRRAIRTRLGDRRGLRDRASRTAGLSLRRALARSDALAVALRARCLAYNPTLPRLQLAGWDYPVLALATALALSPLV